MKKAFHDNTDGDEIETQFQEKFTQCMAELRSGFNELIKRRKEYKLAKQSKRSNTKTDWKVIKEEHKNRIKLCKVKIAEARSDFKLLVESMKLNNGAKATVA